MIKFLLRNTLFFFLFTERFIEEDENWSYFDLEEWSSRYEWESDDWKGMKDMAQRPKRTVSEESGDCVDYALVSLCWLAAQDGKKDYGIAFCFGWTFPFHMIAFDENNTYSSGVIEEQSVEEYIQDSEYRFALKRKVNISASESFFCLKR